MKVLFDFNNLACRCTYREKAGHGGQPHWGKVAFSMFGEVLGFIKGVREFLDAGEELETVLAYDSVHGYWRGDLYPLYKADRDDARDKSDLDWDAARREFSVIASLLGRATPWKVLQVDKCEADDVIFTLATDSNDPVIIYSGDSDYLQLVSDNVSLWMPHHDCFAEFPRICRIGGGEAYCETPEVYLNYAILTGQGGKDNVYNVKTPSDWDCACGKRKPGFGVVAAKKVLDKPDFMAELSRLGFLENYKRNRALIDMQCLPVSWRDKIRESYKSAMPAKPDIGIIASYYGWQPPGFDAERTDCELAFAADGGNFETPADIPASQEEALEFSL